MRHPRLICPLALLAFFCAVVAAEPGKAKGRPAAPIVPIVELSGSADQIGRQHAQKLGPQVKELHEKYLGPWFADEVLHRKAQLAAVIFRQLLNPEHKAELDAFADELKINMPDLMLGNCFLDLIPALGCSTVTLPADASPDGVARFGRNLDFPSMNIADKHTVLLVVRPEGRFAYAAVTWPGLIGVLSGMNEHGLTLANMEVTRTARLPQAMPYTLLYRTVLERCKTVDEAIKLLTDTPRQTPNNLMLMDAAGNRAVVELRPEGIAVRRGQDRTALVSTNHQRGDDQDTPRRCWRYDTLRRESARQFGKEDVPALQGMLGQVAQGKMTLQSMVFEPANRVIYLAAGEQATKNPYRRVDLKPYFWPK